MGNHSKINNVVTDTNFMVKSMLFAMLLFFPFLFLFLFLAPASADAATVFSDNFNNDYGELSTHTPTTTGTSWTQVISNGGVTLSVQSYNNDVNITSNTLNAGALYQANGTYNTADYEISSKVTNYEGSSSYPRSMAVRIQDANNMYLLRYVTTSIIMYKRVSGTWSTIGSATVTNIAVGDTVTFSAIGSTLTAEVNDVTKLTVTDSSITGIGTAGIGFGYINISTDDSGTGQHIDDVVVTDSDTTAPIITSVSSDKANGSYKAGEVIDIDVTFSEAVTSTGNVTITLETGDTDRTCTFTVSNSTTGTCDYTVQAGDSSADLNTSISGTIADQSSNAMSNYTPTTTLAANKALVIDTTAPTIPGTPSATSAGNDNTPSLSWTASSDGGSGVGVYLLQWSSTLNFSSYTQATPASSSYTLPVSLSDGTWYLRVAGRDNADNTSAYSSSSSLIIDTVVPTNSTLVPANGSTGVTTNTSLVLVFNEPVNVSTGNFSIRKSSDDSLFETIAVNSANVTGSGTDTLVVTPTVNFAQGTGYYVLIEPNAITDQAGNAYGGITDPGIWSFTTSTLQVSTTPNGSNSSGSSNTPLVIRAQSETTQSDIPDSQNKILLNAFTEFANGQGKQITLKKGQTVYFTVDDKEHSATVKEFGEDYVVVTFASTPVDVQIRIGQTVQHDVNGDGIPDITATLNNITNGVVNISFKQLAAPAATIPSSNQDQVGESNFWDSYWLYIIFVITTVTLVLMIMLHHRKTPA